MTWTVDRDSDGVPQRLLWDRSPVVDVSQVLAALDGKGWRSARWLGQELHLTDRAVRELASRSEGQIISGQQGYALTSQATVVDVLHAASWLRSQAKQMEQRAYQIERAMHRRTA